MAVAGSIVVADRVNTSPPQNCGNDDAQDSLVGWLVDWSVRLLTRLKLNVRGCAIYFV